MDHNSKTSGGSRWQVSFDSINEKSQIYRIGYILKRKREE
jgi:hypothetical protein